MDSIIDILSQGRDREAQASKIHGFVVGIVTNNQDPDKLGRIKVKFPWLSEQVESWWARIVYPMAGKERGFWFIPEIDDEVLVGFEHGDVRFPYILGSLYNGVDTPPKADDTTSAFGGTGFDHGGWKLTDLNEDGKNDIRFIRSRSGHLFVFDDKEGDESITLTDHTGKHRLQIHTKDKRVVITSEDGDIELIASKKVLIRCEELETESRQDTKMKAGGKFDAESTGNMTHKTSGNMTAEASNNINQKAGMNFASKASMNVTIDGMNVTCKGSVAFTAQGVNATVKGTAMLTLKGGMVMIN